MNHHISAKLYNSQLRISIYFRAKTCKIGLTHSDKEARAISFKPERNANCAVPEVLQLFRVVCEIKLPFFHLFEVLFHLLVHPCVVCGHLVVVVVVVWGGCWGGSCCCCCWALPSLSTWQGYVFARLVKGWTDERKANWLGYGSLTGSLVGIAYEYCWWLAHIWHSTANQKDYCP